MVKSIRYQGSWQDFGIPPQGEPERVLIRQVLPENLCQLSYL